MRLAITAGLTAGASATDSRPASRSPSMVKRVLAGPRADGGALGAGGSAPAPSNAPGSQPARGVESISGLAGRRGAGAQRARGDASSLATAAALRYRRAGHEAERDPAAAAAAPWIWRLARASSIPQMPSIGWLRLQLCAGTAGCDIREAATTMRWVDADNGAVWLPTLAAAQKDKDPAEVDRILADMAAGLALRLLLESNRGADVRRAEARGAAICRPATCRRTQPAERGHGGRGRRDRAAVQRR